MSRPRRLRWSPLPPSRTIPKHPYRDTTILYGFLALVLVLIAWASGTSIKRAIVLAVLVFVVASAWSALGWRRRIRERAEADEFDG